MKEVTVFNDKATAYKTGDYPLFFGEEPSVYDSINRPHQFLYDKMEELKELDWSPDDVDLTETRMDLLRCDKKTRELMLLNLAYQWSLDSIATSLPVLLAPFITNSEYAHCMMRIGDNENNHSDTYSNIVRQCLDDPQEVFNMIFENEKVLERSSVVGKALSDLKRVGAEYTLGLKTEDDCRPYVLKGVVAIYALERMSFPSSFSCTFALAQQEYFVGAARLVQKILIDEMIHYSVGAYVLKDMMKDPKWVPYFDMCKDEISDIVHGVLAQETDWNKYLFSSGRNIVGLNEGILNDWSRYCTQEVTDTLNIEPKFRRTVTCPLPWFEKDWMNINAQQNANMESDATNYMVSAVKKDVTGVDLSDLPFGEEFSDEDEEVSTLEVYTKDSCPFCVKLKAFLKDNNFAFKEVEATLPEHREFLMAKGLRTVPQVFDQFGNYKGDCTSFIENYS